MGLRPTPLDGANRRNRGRTGSRGWPSARRALGPAAGRDGHLIYGRAAKSGEQISAQLNFVTQDPIGRHEIWLTADVSGRLHISHNGKTFEISGASEAVTADGRQVTGRWWQSMNPLRFK